MRNGILPFLNFLVSSGLQNCKFLETWTKMLCSISHLKKFSGV
jgi:hypothetical protein